MEKKIASERTFGDTAERKKKSVKIVEVEKEAVEETKEEEAVEDEDEIFTIKDLCKIGRTDIQNARKKDMLFDLVCLCIGLVLKVSEYRTQLEACLGKSEKMQKKIAEIIKIPKFRQEVITIISLNLNRKMSMPNYVAIIGNDYELAVKYSKGTMMQILVVKTFNISLFEVPRIAINSLQQSNRLTDEDIDSKREYPEL